ncbi:radical SAM protein [Infirmifilum lucidum]|uniref:Radical SAM protein n=1 Tax=Infirmifilum lucidum TaxID=2776706 RepID=A0A7L9FEZ8_9CREN|nr:radical SAM protein [Infirmifilum lucidum]QOJ78201.1 radical SAM protein [Infirmifilum lucidum]
MSVRRLPTGSIVYGNLPRGCRLCQEGLKTVIFLTGLCPLRCFYCPLGAERKNRDVIFVNEANTDEPRLVEVTVFEVLRSASRGASLTGGEPLVQLKRAVEVIRGLKERFGASFHIHLYTSGVPLTREAVQSLADAGLDELRIHAPFDILEDRLKLVREYNDKLDLGLEYPSLPGGEEALAKVIDLAEKYELQFVNLNELEFTETNYSSLLLRGYRMKKDYRSARSSRGTALKVIQMAEKKMYSVAVHFCPVAVKDYQQTGLRYYRTATLVSKPHQLVTDEGTTLELEYTELKHEAGEVAHYYPPGVLHFFLIDIMSRGRVVERAPLLNWMSVEETPV